MALLSRPKGDLTINARAGPVWRPVSAQVVNFHASTGAPQGA
jgi:hypothetical protein